MLVMDRFNGSRYIKIRDMDIANGEYIGCAVYFQGCPFHCLNCFNEETWDFDGGKEWTSEETRHILTLIEGVHIKRITFLGGEPFIDRNLDLLCYLTKEIKRKRPDIKIWIYSGFLLDNLIYQNDDADRKGRLLDILSNVDILVDGQFKDDLKDFRMRFRGSSNQRIINIPETLKVGHVILNDKLMELRH
jgi:anaerobic ribonucleoside-triphosphate reductase activating protein